VSPACLEFPGFRAYREYPGSVNLGFRAIPAFLASQVIRATREFPAGRAYRVNPALPVIQGFLASQVIRANREFQAGRAYRVNPALPVIQGFLALEQSHNWRRSVQTRLWRSKNFYSRLVS
jgi:hypothetical protein